MEKEERSMQHLEKIVCCSDHSAFHILAQVFHIYHTFTINLDVLAKLKGHSFSMYVKFFEKLTLPLDMQTYVCIAGGKKC